MNGLEGGVVVVVWKVVGAECRGMGAFEAGAVQKLAKSERVGGRG